MAERRGTKALELWCRRMVEGYPGVKIDNMTTSWRDGLAFCAIIHHFHPELIDFAKLNKDNIYDNNELAFTVAEKHLGIPALLDPEDMVEYDVPDRLSILTYVAQFYRTFASSQASSPSRMVPKRTATASERGIVSPASTSPPTKIIHKVGIPRRDPCTKCGLPVFIAERLNVGKGSLFHRTCFRCARCNSQLSLANYYETDSNQFCCETCPDEETPSPITTITRSLSDEEKSNNNKSNKPNISCNNNNHSDSYSCNFETALESANLSLNSTKNSDLTSISNEFVTARSKFLTMQVDEEEKPPELPKTNPPDLKKTQSTQPEESIDSVNKNLLKNSDNKNNNDNKDMKNVVTKDVLNDSNLTKPTSVRDRMKLFETPISEVPMATSEKKNTTKIIKYDDIDTSSPLNDATTNKINRISLSPINAETSKLTESSSLPSSPSPSKLNILLEKQLLKKSLTSPSINSDLGITKVLSSERNQDLTQENVNVLSKLQEKPPHLPQKSPEVKINQDLTPKDDIIFHKKSDIEEIRDVSLIEAKIVDVSGVLDTAPAVDVVASLEIVDTNVENHVDDDVSEKFLEENDSKDEIGKISGDGDLKRNESSVTKSLCDEFTSDDVIIIDDSDDINNSQDYQNTQDNIIIEISSDDQLSQDIIEISHEKLAYPEDLNPFGEVDEEECLKQEKIETISSLVNHQKSLNPFDEDDDDEEIEDIPKKSQDVPQKPIPLTRKNIPDSKREHVKKEVSLNPFDSDDEDDENVEDDKKMIENEIKPPVKKVIAAPVLELNQDLQDSIYVKRISLSPSVVGQYKQINVKKKVVAAPRLTLNSLWTDHDDCDDDDDNLKYPVPTPRKIRNNQETPERKLRDQHLPAIYGSNSSLSSATSGGQSVRKKKPAPRPPILSPESTQSSLTSSPSTSAQHSPRLSSSKNRKTKRAPPPPTHQRNLFEVKNDLTFIERENMIRESSWEEEKENKNVENQKRQSISDDSDHHPQRPSYIPNKSTYGKWKKKKGPAPSRPIPQKRNVKQLPVKEIKKELDLIELQQQGLEKQGVRLEQIIRERCEGPLLDPNEIDPIEVDDLMLQLFEVVNEKNELCRRQAELMYLRRQHRLEEEHADVEYQLRCLMMEPEATKTDSDKAREEELIARIVEIVERRNEIVECLEIDRLRENDEDNSITNSMNDYAAKRDEGLNVIENVDKKEKKKKKKLKINFSKKTDLDKDVDESESTSNKEKKKKKFALF
ncbi:MICAL-like protein 1 [Onthophagus taurus]|uniref:MICAL-like protein 1 n=1 Tax=Onthophagus taurus TaxID=166361 RepID=UPI0039BE2222